MKLFGYTVEWMPKGMRPFYCRTPFIDVFRYAGTRTWFAVWIGDRIRIGRRRQ